MGNNIVPAVLIIVILILVLIIIHRISTAIRRFKSNSDVANVFRVLRAVNWDQMNAEPQPKSLSSSTPIYLNRISEDFPEFHYSEAESAIKAFLTEYLSVLYGEKQKITVSNASELLKETVCPGNITGISDINVHKSVITAYSKTLDYATIKFRSAVGYRLNGTLHETRFETNYTLKLSGDDTALQAVTCPNCGGNLTDTGNRKCAYCGCDLVVDTVLSWVITDVKEI